MFCNPLLAGGEDGNRVKNKKKCIRCRSNHLMRFGLLWYIMMNASLILYYSRRNSLLPTVETSKTNDPDILFGKGPLKSLNLLKHTTHQTVTSGDMSILAREEKSPSYSSKQLLIQNSETSGVNIDKIVVGDKEEIRRLSPRILALHGDSSQLDDELLVHIGGFTQHYNDVSRAVQFFNITSQTWIDDRTLELPTETAETHAGLAFDASSRMLYVISGQKGPGCSPATTASVRMNVDTGKYQRLPDLPYPTWSGNCDGPHPPHSKIPPRVWWSIRASR